MKKAFSALFFFIFAVNSCVFADQVFLIDLSQSTIQSSSEEVEVSMGLGVYYNRYYGNSWLMHVPNRSYIRVIFKTEVMAIEKATLKITHLASLVGKKFFAPITIQINDQAIVSGFSPASYNYITDIFDLTGYVHEGVNSIELSFDGGAPCNYWIQSLNLDISGR